MIIQIIVTFFLTSAAYGLLIDIPCRIGNYFNKRDGLSRDGAENWMVGIVLCLFAVFIASVILGLYHLAGFLIPFIN